MDLMPTLGVAAGEMREPALLRPVVARVTVEELPNPGEVLLAPNRHYQRPPEASVPAYQLTYDDTQGRFPWDPGYANESDL